MLRCALDGAEATVAHTTHAFARHSHDRFGIGVVVAGGQRSASGRGPVEARASDVITVVNPGEVHDGSSLDERGRAWRMLYFEPSLIYRMLGECAQAPLPEVELTRPVLNDPQLSARFTQLFLVVVSGTQAEVTPDNLACEKRWSRSLRISAAVTRRCRPRDLNPLLPARAQDYASTTMPLYRRHSSISLPKQA